MTGKFDSARDEALYQMTLEGWANQLDGNVEAPTGWFALIVNEPADMLEIMQGFDFNESLREPLTGYFILIENDQGFVTVESFDNELAAAAQYTALLTEANEWFDTTND